MKEKNLYETPSVEVFKTMPEGILCASGEIEQWNEETIFWEK